MSPQEHFAQELGELIEKWANKPKDDRLTYGEMIQTLEYRKLLLFWEIQKKLETT